jgi:peroxiredoxin Q/BCP
MLMLRCGILVMLLCAAPLACAGGPPDPGAPAPDFRLRDAAGREHGLGDWRGKWLVLYFYPKDDTPGCTAEAIGFRDRQAKLAELDAQVVGISLDDGASHQAFAAKHKLGFTLLSDRDGTVAKRYGALSDFGILRYARRYTFLIDPDGRVAKRYLDVDAGRHADEIVADLKALR